MDKFEDFTEKDLETYLVKDMYSLSDESISTVNFIYWLIYCIEKSIRKMLEIFAYDKSNQDSIQSILLDSAFDELTLFSKIRTLEKTLKSLKDHGIKHKIFISFSYELNSIRNQISHNRIEELKYKKRLISNLEVKHEMIKDFKIALASIINM